MKLSLRRMLITDARCRPAFRAIILRLFSSTQKNRGKPAYKFWKISLSCRRKARRPTLGLSRSNQGFFESLVHSYQELSRAATLGFGRGLSGILLNANSQNRSIPPYTTCAATHSWANSRAFRLTRPSRTFRLYTTTAQSTKKRWPLQPPYQFLVINFQNFTAIFCADIS